MILISMEIVTARYKTSMIMEELATIASGHLLVPVLLLHDGDEWGGVCAAAVYLAEVHPVLVWLEGPLSPRRLRV